MYFTDTHGVSITFLAEEHLDKNRLYLWSYWESYEGKIQIQYLSDLCTHILVLWAITHLMFYWVVWIPGSREGVLEETVCLKNGKQAPALPTPCSEFYIW